MTKKMTRWKHSPDGDLVMLERDFVEELKARGFSFPRGGWPKGLLGNYEKTILYTSTYARLLTDESWLPFEEFLLKVFGGEKCPTCGEIRFVSRRV